MKDLALILNQIKSKKFLPIYFLHGDEPYFIDIAIKNFENDALSEDEKAFNQIIVYGKDTNIGEIISLAKQYPMMGDKQLILVKEAQDLKLNEEENKILENYAENAVESTILVFGYKKKLDARKKFAKMLEKKKMIFLSEKIKDYEGNVNLSRWIADECKNLGIKTSPNIPGLLAEYLGNDLSKISNELGKIKIILKEGDIFNEKMAEENIGISKEYNIFELQKALATKNSNAAMKIAYFMGVSKSFDFFMTLGSLFSFFTDLLSYQTFHGQSHQSIATQLGKNYYAIREYPNYTKNYPLKSLTKIISILREFDLKAKGLGAVNMSNPEIMTEMVYKILNVDKTKSKL